jgi:hypothetical protein
MSLDGSCNSSKAGVGSRRPTPLLLARRGANQRLDSAPSLDVGTGIRARGLHLQLADRKRPAATFRNVLLPEPDGPIRAVNDPRARPTVAPSRATTDPSPRPYTVRTPRRTAAGVEVTATEVRESS